MIFVGLLEICFCVLVSDDDLRVFFVIVWLGKIVVLGRLLGNDGVFWIMDGDWIFIFFMYGFGKFDEDWVSFVFKI